MDFPKKQILFNIKNYALYFFKCTSLLLLDFLCKNKLVVNSKTCLYKTPCGNSIKNLSKNVILRERILFFTSSFSKIPFGFFGHLKENK